MTSADEATGEQIQSQTLMYNVYLLTSVIPAIMPTQIKHGLKSYPTSLNGMTTY